MSAEPPTFILTITADSEPTPCDGCDRDLKRVIGVVVRWNNNYLCLECATAMLNQLMKALEQQAPAT